MNTCSCLPNGVLISKESSGSKVTAFIGAADITRISTCGIRLELHLNVLAGFVPHLPERYRDAEYVFLGNIDPVMQLEVLNQIHRLKLVVCDTMDHWIQGSWRGAQKSA